ncbi:hypothetical protein LMH81_25525 [Vibrio lentus]|nr:MULTISPECIES: hypothetical protein [Vibrio]MCC4819889.1 hypothetical protein [Vibrio lentus]PMJ25853.1 hypothetical protein BCU27_09845 [Vibrio sp. 10N.286.45.B6]PMM78679.1 hypothetical protein BCT48_00470 [Vibrio sp. 10N.261.46.F12]PMM86588.1 hypothetical protein BCT46_07805 [Vibrio sp. 10N.261.46.E8]PMN35119.1 hypothetical protein BCT34_09020 [Vibrio sp. 10N.261.45.E2]
MSNERFTRTEEEQKESKEIYDKFREELSKRQLFNNEGYDKAVLSLSASGLALSLTAIRFITPLEKSSYLLLIQASWFLFLITVISSIIAYQISNKAISKQLEIAERYYIQALVSAEAESNPYLKFNSYLNITTGIFFCFAITFVVLFVTLNIENQTMSNKKTIHNAIVTDSADMLRMQTAPSGKLATASADIPSMQMAPGIKTTSTGQSSAGNGKETSKSSESKSGQ